MFRFFILTAAYSAKTTVCPDFVANSIPVCYIKDNPSAFYHKKEAIP